LPPAAALFHAQLESRLCFCRLDDRATGSQPWRHDAFVVEHTHQRVDGQLADSRAGGPIIVINCPRQYNAHLLRNVWNNSIFTLLFGVWDIFVCAFYAYFCGHL
jgi:hypothetical protein